MLGSARCGNLNTAVPPIALALRYPSDLSDGEWLIVEPMIPAGQTRRAAAFGECTRGAERDLLHPVDRLPMAGVTRRISPPKSTVRELSMSSGTRMARWSASITNCTLRCASRKAGNRARQWPLSTAPDSQRLVKRRSLLDPSGYDAGKKIKGRNTAHPGSTRWALLLNVVVNPADVQDRDGVFPFAAPSPTTVPVHRIHFLLMADMPDGRWLI